MKRPDTALTGIDQKLSAEITWALDTTERSHLDAVRAAYGASGVLKVMLLFAVVLVVVGTQMPGLTWVGTSVAAIAVAGVGVFAYRLLHRKGAEARDYLDDYVARNYRAVLLLVREHDVIVKAARPALTRYAP